MLMKGKLFICNEWFETENIKRVINPFTKQVIGELCYASEVDVENAIISAEKAYYKFKNENQYTKAKLLNRMAEAIRNQSESLAILISIETGKPIADARSEVQATVRSFEWYGIQISNENNDVVPSHDKALQIVVKEAVGVVALITPWNFPLNLIARKLAPALAAGNSVIIKPSSKSGLVAKKLIEIIEPCLVDQPKGLVSLIYGSSEKITDQLMSSSCVRKISFTGSTRVGKILARSAANTLKKTSLELGGNSPFIVSEHADVKQAAKALIKAKLRNNGQVCVSPNKIIVSTKIMDEFIKCIEKTVTEISYGDPLFDESNYSCVIDDASGERIISILEDAYQKGAVCVFEDKIDSVEVNAIPLTIIKNVNSSMRIYHEEIFGPIVSIVEYDTIEKAISIANDTQYGLASYLFSTNPDEIRMVSTSLGVGLIGVNHTNISTSETPFGGVKESGYGVENGQYGLQEYQNLKLISINI